MSEDNNVFGSLTVTNTYQKNSGKRNRLVSDCTCVCGREITVRHDELLKGARTKCRKLCTESLEKRYGMIVITGSHRRHRESVGTMITYLDFKCDCGNTGSAIAQNVTNGHTTSCGCKTTVHGDGSNTKSSDNRTRLYRCWGDMKRRAYLRGGDCDVYKPWRSSFQIFKDWSLANGYTDELVLCRNADRGDYRPDNCRWDTVKNNNYEMRGLPFTPVNPMYESNS